MVAQDPQTTALLSHIVSQTESNINFLVSQNHLSHSDASAFLSTLRGISSSPIGSVTPQFDNMGVKPNAGSNSFAPPMPSGPASSYATPPPAPAPAPAVPQYPQAKALWGYNENGQDPNDLSFRTGDVIDIIEETNADWWMGRVGGKQALFPANYVEKLPPPSASSHTAPPYQTQPSPYPNSTWPTPAPASYDSGPTQYQNSNEQKTPYRPFGAAMHGTDTPPPAGAGINSVGLQQAPGQEPKKNKFGKLGSTMATSAAGGVGFGAGAAIGSGLVNAIF